MRKHSIERAKEELSNGIFSMSVGQVYAKGQAIEGPYPQLGAHTRHSCGRGSTGMGLARVWVRVTVRIPAGIPVPMPRGAGVSDVKQGAGNE